MIFRFGATNKQKQLGQRKVLKWPVVHAGAEVSGEVHSLANEISVSSFKVFEISFIYVI